MDSTDNDPGPEPPSSPPLFYSATAKVPSPKLPPRKRPRLSDQGYHSYSSNISNSSDGPFFSSDDLAEANASSYTSPQRKKQYKRRWYEPQTEEQAVSYRAMREAMRRPKDSGVFMGSDSSGSGSEGFELETAQLKTRAVQKQSKIMQAFLSEAALPAAVPSSPPPASPRKPTTTEADAVVSQVVTTALETSREEIDLTCLHLQTLPVEAFTPLQHFIKHPSFHPDAYTDAACAPLIPKLKIFLANNALTSIPSSLFDLTHLTVLSLRNNNLTRLPSAIGRLTQLEILNLNGNPLPTLPWEIIRLVNGTPTRPGNLTWLHVSTTCMLEPTHLHRRFSAPSSSAPRFQRTGRTAPKFFGVDGTAVPPSRHAPATSHAPSLFELALRAATASSSFPDLESFLPVDTPETVFRAVSRARRVIDEEGPNGRTCSVCARGYLIRRAEWVEFARLPADAQNGLRGPMMTLDQAAFERGVCSWGCAEVALESDGF